MYNYSIMPLITESLEEICQDIKLQYEKGISNMALFSMSLVPEGNPVINKADILCKKYDLFRDRLAEMGLECGILVQSSIGHGYPLKEKFPFQSCVNLEDFESDGSDSVKEYFNTVGKCCPYDEDVREHFKGVMETLAQHNPATIMVDDDFRLLFTFGKGCACPLHMAEFNKRANTNITRKELWEIIKDRNHKDNKRFSEIFEETQNDSLVGLAKAMREGIDKVNPKLQSSICTCGFDPHGEIARILAGEGNPTIMRVNNGRYSTPGARNLSEPMMVAAMQMALECNKADVFLAETDTCPQNRYSTSAQYLHSHFVGTILEGANGAKHWITRFTKKYDKVSGKAYRDILSKNSGLYHALAELYPKLQWVGCRIPLPKKISYPFHIPAFTLPTNTWANCVIERLGLPLYFSSNNGGAVFLDDTYYEYFNDDELKEFFKGTTVLSALCAENLNKKGFTQMTGVEVREWQGIPADSELLYIDNNDCNKQHNLKELVPINDKVLELSSVVNVTDDDKITKLFPGVTAYKNPLGGVSFVVSGTPNTPLHYSVGFSFLNRSRKLQLIDMLKQTGNLPIYYDGDAEVYMKAANTPDGELFAAIFNIGMDPIEGISLGIDRKVDSIKMMMPNGNLENVNFRIDSDKYIVETTAYTLNPVILFIK